MAIVSLLDVSLSFGGAPLLDKVNLQIDRGERVCLVGRNGAGKSTLMKVINGELNPDVGQVFRQQGAVFTTLRQEFLAPLAESAAREDSKNYVEAYPLPLTLAIGALVAQAIIGVRRHQRPRLPSALRPTTPPVVP